MRIRSRVALVIAAVAVASASMAVAVTAGATPSRSAERHHLLAVHSARRWHAERVHAAALREARADHAAAVLEQDADFQAAYGPYWIDGFTTNTPAWACIRLNEEGVTQWDNAYQYDRNGSVGAYGFVAGGPSSVAGQDALAISIFRTNGWKWGPTAWSTHTVCGLP